MLPFLADVEPLSALMAGVWLFAAGMLPVGIMLGSSCSPCCGGGSPPCSQCTEGELPDTLTVTFDDYPEFEPGTDLITVNINSCSGSGATGRILTPSDNPGPISNAILVAGGSGYAKLGRAEPVLVASTPNPGANGSGATFTPTFTKKVDSCENDWWDIASVAASGGRGYAMGDLVVFMNQEATTSQHAALGYISAVGGRVEPALTATVATDGGTGASFEVTVVPLDTTPGSETWAVASVTVLTPGSGYSNGQAIQFGDGIAVAQAQATIKTVLADPVLIATAGGSGSGAVLSPVLTKTGPTYWWPFEFWTVASIAIVDGGGGYSPGDPVFLGLTAGYGDWYPTVSVSSVSPSGGITGLSISPMWSGDNGVFTQGETNGAVESVTVADGGAYYEGSAAEGVSVFETVPSQLYQEDETLPPTVEAVTVSLTQTPPSNGAGAQLSASVDSTVGSPTFGQVTGLTITNGGSGYIAHKLRRSCRGYLGGRSIVVRKSQGDPCLYIYECNADRDCGIESEIVAVGYRGPNQPLGVSAILSKPTWQYDGDGRRIWNYVLVADMTAEELTPSCSSISVRAASVPPYVELGCSVSPGGEYVTPSCRRILNSDYDGISTEITWGPATVTQQPVGDFGCGFFSGFGALMTGSWNRPGAATVLVSGVFEVRVVDADDCFPRLMPSELTVNWQSQGGQGLGFNVRYSMEFDRDEDDFPVGQARLIEVFHSDRQLAEFVGFTDVPTVTITRLP